MTSQAYEVFKPKVSVRMYWPEAVFLGASFAAPIVAWLIWHDGQMLGRSGSVMVLFAAVAEFITLNRMNDKHLLNACRVKAQEKPWDFSRAARAVGVIALFAALLGTLIWGYGDLLVAPHHCS